MKSRELFKKEEARIVGRAVREGALFGTELLASCTFLYAFWERAQYYEGMTMDEFLQINTEEINFLVQSVITMGAAGAALGAALGLVWSGVEVKKYHKKRLGDKISPKYRKGPDSPPQVTKR